MTTDFRSLQLSAALVEVTAELGYTSMTDIQARSIPVLLAGKDLVAQSRTGSGKTAAFALPILQTLELSPRTPKALVLCPTRELGAQVAREIRKLGRKHEGLRVLVLGGGESRYLQERSLRQGAHVLVGTPGRVRDHLERGSLDLGALRTVVLDEADRMLEMGFEADMQAILSAVPTPRQLAFFSATFPASMEAMSARYQASPERVTVETQEAERSEIRHLATIVEADERLPALRAALEGHPHESALIFANFKASVASLQEELSKAGLSVDALHGDLEQYERDRVMAKFRNGSTRILVATDVAARGIDVQGLDLVVNYELPKQPATYVHRAGRTGRAGKTGVAVSLVTSRELSKLTAIEQLLGAPLERAASMIEERGAKRTPAQKPAPEREARMDTLRIWGGRKQKVRPGDLLGALTGEAGGLQGSDVGKIEIHDNFSYVAVSRAVSAAALKSLIEGRIKGRKFRVTLES